MSLGSRDRNPLVHHVAEWMSGEFRGGVRRGASRFNDTIGPPPGTQRDRVMAGPSPLKSMADTTPGALPDDFQITLGNPVVTKTLVASFQDPLSRERLIFIHLPRIGEDCFGADDLCQSGHQVIHHLGLEPGHYIQLSMPVHLIVLNDIAFCRLIMRPTFLIKSTFTECLTLVPMALTRIKEGKQSGAT